MNSPSMHLYAFSATAQKPTTAKVWKAVIDGRQVTVIDPDRCTAEQMLRILEQKFGVHRIGKVREGWR